MAPVMAGYLRPVLAPAFEAIGADPSLFAGIIFPSDAGGAHLAANLAVDKEAGLFNGYVVGSIIGPTMIFTIPVSIASAPSQARRPLVIYGLLAGIVTAPLGMIAGGLLAGFSPRMLFHNLCPIVLFVLCLFVTLIYFTESVVKLFLLIGKASLTIAYFGLTIAAIKKLSGYTLIRGMEPIETAFSTVGGIALILTGAFPMLAIITRCFPWIVTRLANRLRIEKGAISGLLATTANSISTFNMISDMSKKGTMINVAFAVAASWALGDHMAFTAQTQPTMLIPVIASKFVAGVCAVSFSILMDTRLHV